MSLADETFSKSQLAALCRLDRRTVAKRLAHVAPVEVNGSGKRYRLEDALPALCRRDTQCVLTARERLTTLQGDLVVSTLAERNRQLVDVKRVSKVWVTR